MLYSADRATRKLGYEMQHLMLGEHSTYLMGLLRAVIRNRAAEAKARGYESAFAMRLHGDRLNPDVPQAMFEAINQNLDLLRDMLLFKGAVLGIDKVSRIDAFASPFNTVEPRTFEESCQRIFGAYREFSPEFAEGAHIIFKAGNVHSKPIPDKRGNAMSWQSCVGGIPFLLLNHHGTTRDEESLAHECAHGAQGSLITNGPNGTKLRPDQLPPQFTAKATAPAGEATAVFGETLYHEWQLRNEPELELEHLTSELGRVIAAVYRIAHLATFELEMYKLIEDGASATQIFDQYYRKLSEQFGPEIEVPEYMRYELLKIHHIATHPHYLYTYAFGKLIGTKYYSVSEEQGAEPVLSVIRNGGNVDFQQALMDLGMDLSSTSDWEVCFDTYRRKLERAKIVARERGILLS